MTDETLNSSKRQVSAFQCYIRKRFSTFYVVVIQTEQRREIFTSLKFSLSFKLSHNF